MKLVAYSFKQVEIPDGEYEGIITEKGSPYCHIIVDRDNQFGFNFETVNNLVLSKGICTVKVYKNRAAIYI